MKRLYVFTVDDGEVTGLIYELLTCEQCEYFRKAEEHGYRYRDSCGHPAGMVRPTPDGWCSYGREKEDHE